MSLPLHKPVSNTRRAQSAMEYLMTYGWSILIIAIVITGIFKLGVFSSGQSSLPAECTAQAGFLCSSIQMNTTGYLLMTFGQSLGGSMQITGVGCSNTTSEPGSFSIYYANLYTGQQASLTFQCPLKSSSIGSSLSGTLWIQYNRGSSTGLVSEVATFTAKAATPTPVGSSSGESSLLEYLPITLSNQQSSGTGTDFQQLISFNPSNTAYSSNEVANLSNIEFTTGAPAGSAGSVPLYAWIESNAFSTSTNTVIWVNLSRSSLGAAGSGSNTLTLYMNFLTNNVPVTSGYTGYAPQLYCASGCFQSSYGQYDDGYNVFLFYQNWKGTSNPSGWSVGSGWTVNNGISSTHVSSTTYSTTLFGPNVIEDAYTNLTTSISGGTDGYFFGFYDASPASEVYFLAIPGFVDEFTAENPSGSSAETVALPTGFWVSTIDWSSSQAYYRYNYGAPGGTETTDVPTTSSPLYMSNIYSSGSEYTLTVRWIRVRSYPPSDVMPSFSFGTPA